jgi:hypothetical protein
MNPASTITSLIANNIPAATFSVTIFGFGALTTNMDPQITGLLDSAVGWVAAGSLAASRSSTPGDWHTLFGHSSQAEDPRLQGHHWPARFKRFGFQSSWLLRVGFFGSGGSVSALQTLNNIQAINPSTLPNRTSIHPQAMRYKRKVMRCLVPGLRSRFVFCCFVQGR